MSEVDRWVRLTPAGGITQEDNAHLVHRGRSLLDTVPSEGYVPNRKKRVCGELPTAFNLPAGTHRSINVLQPAGLHAV